jgi:DeoR/GlpR family transcriptional regulator of sugar metabolism
VAWNRIKKAADRQDVSPRQMRRYLKEGLRHSRIHGTVFISDEALDEFFKRHEVQTDEVSEIVDQVMADIY